MSDFVQFARANGVLVPDDLPPGRWVRCPTVGHPRKKNGTAKLSEDGRAGWVHDWAIHAEPILWRANGTEKPVYIDRREIESRRLQREREVTEAAEAAGRFYATCKPLRASDKHPYLEAKRIDMQGCEGLRVDRETNLVVPMWIEGRLASVQRIAADGSKLFWLGGQSKGASYVISRKLATITVFCEGLATGLTIFAAMDCARVVVGFNAGNLPAIVFKPRFGLCIVCGDNDQETAERIGRNPGVDAAVKAADRIGASVAIPDIDPVDGTDFNDLFKARLHHWSQMGLGKYRRSEDQFKRRALADVRHAIMQSTHN